MDANRSNSRNARSIRSLLMSAAALPFLLSLGFHAVGPSAREPRKGTDRPALVFDQYLVDLGPVLPEPHVFAHYVFHNRGQSPVKILEVEPSCGCLKPEFKDNKREYAPGESGQFFLTVKTTRETPGQKEYYVKLRYEDPEPREIDVSFRFDLPQHQVQVRPSVLRYLYQSNEEMTKHEEITQQVVITDNRPKPLRVRDVATTEEYLTARIGKVVEDDDGARQTAIEVTVSANVPPGTHRTAVSVLTDDPVYKEIQIPVMIHGPGPAAEATAPPLVQVSPEMLQLNPTVEKQAEGEIVFTDSQSKGLRPTSVISTSPAVKVKIGKTETDAQGRKFWRIAVTAITEEGIPAGRYRSLINIHTDDPTQKELQVPVHVVVPKSEGMVVPASGVNVERR